MLNKSLAESLGTAGKAANELNEHCAPQGKFGFFSVPGIKHSATHFPSMIKRRTTDRCVAWWRPAVLYRGDRQILISSLLGGSLGGLFRSSVYGSLSSSIYTVESTVHSMVHSKFAQRRSSANGIRQARFRQLAGGTAVDKSKCRS